MKWQLDNYMVHITRTPKEKSWHCTYHETFGEAKAKLVQRTKKEVKEYKHALSLAIKRLKKAEAMKEPK